MGMVDHGAPEVTVAVPGDLIGRARAVATAAHTGQVDKNGHPYITHPQAVAALLADLPTYQALSPAEREWAVAVAWLHDTFEDTPLTASDLAGHGFPPPVVDAVTALTHRPHEPRTDYYARVLTNPLARVVKTADLAHNLHPERLAGLDAATVDRLRGKYATATAIIVTDTDQATFTALTHASTYTPTP